jgi:hypothetical protein
VFSLACLGTEGAITARALSSKPHLAHPFIPPSPPHSYHPPQNDLPAPSMPVGSISSRLVLIGRFSGDVAALKERYTKELQAFLAPGYFALPPKR